MQGGAAEGLVFVRQRGSQGDLFRARLSDGAVTSFLETGDRDESWPFWSEAGGALVYQSDPLGGGDADLWIWRPGSAEAPLAARPDRDERWADWAPDGARLAFSFRSPGVGSGLASVEVSSGREAVLVPASAAASFLRPIFAPDGTWLAAQGRARGLRRSRLHRVDAEGARPLTPESGWSEQRPAFTRDGRFVYFQREAAGAPREIARVDATGTVSRFDAGAPGADEHSARPSPTRDELAFVSDREGGRDVFLADSGGAAVRNLTRTPDRDEFAPRWSPDGERLALTASPPRARGRAGERFDTATREALRVIVLDREGRVLLETPGMMVDWMPAF